MDELIKRKLRIGPILDGQFIIWIHLQSSTIELTGRLPAAGRTQHISLTTNGGTVIRSQCLRGAKMLKRKIKILQLNMAAAEKHSAPRV